jgi:UDP-glucose 4-epimerase
VHGIPTLGLRFFNVYGARQDPASPYSGVISIFADRLLRGEALTVFGDGLQTRDFVHVSAVVEALRAGMDRADIAAPVFNVCAGRSTTVLGLARTLGEACHRVPVIHHVPGRAGEVRHSLGAPEAARMALGLCEPLELLDGLRGVVDWMRAGRRSLAAAELVEGD